MTCLPAARSTAVLILALAGPAWADPVSLQQQDAVEAYLAPGLVLPSTALWQFEPLKDYVSGQKLVCGKVNFQSSRHTYLGYHQFYAALDGERVTVAQIDNPVEDPSGKLRAKLDLLCGKG